MSTKLAFAAVLLALFPVTVDAGCMGEMHQPTTTSVCEPGQTWDEAAQACVPSASS